MHELRNMSKKYIGKPCKKRHNGERYKSTGVCVVCAKIKAKEKRQRDPDSHADYQRKWRRNKNIKQATPTWTDEGEILHLQEERDRLSNSFKMEFQVIYIIPLRSRVVCGLHVASNMKIVSKSLAKLKGRKFDSKKVSEEQLKLSRLLSSIR